MIRFFHTLRTGLVAIATLALIMSSLSPAFAAERHGRVYDKHCNESYGSCNAPAQRPNYYHSHGNQEPHYHQYNRHKPHAHRARNHKPKSVQHRKKDNTGKWIVAGVLGLAAGAIILSQAQKNKRRHYVRPAPGRIKPKQTHVGHKHNFQPWTKAWYRWCANSYRSFNPRTGTYRGYEGFDHFCVVK